MAVLVYLNGSCFSPQGARLGALASLLLLLLLPSLPACLAGVWVGSGCVRWAVLCSWVKDTLGHHDQREESLMAVAMVAQD